MNTKNETTPPSAGRLINELSRAAHIYFHNEFRKYAIGHAQIRTLFYVANNEGLTQMDLVKHLNLDKSSVTSQLQILEKNGYISRTTSKTDARKQVIGITDKTQKILDPMKQVLATWSNTLLAGFSEEERTSLLEYLLRMRDNASAKVKTYKSTIDCK